MQSRTTIEADHGSERIEATTHVAEAQDIACFHCGTLSRDSSISSQDKIFCCQGCLTVFELLTENGLADFYGFGKAAGVRAKVTHSKNEFSYLDDPALR